ncbi:MAG: hypothetical protein JXQ91_06640 [Vannielia sp.]|uniref:hypothetical protein n=1 Tax=Vannielia sp. TaxID=2813045 RepID=UPI003B8B8255
MAGSDDKSEETKGETAKDEAKAPAVKRNSRKSTASKPAASTTKKAVEPKDTKPGDADPKGANDSNAAPEPVEAKDAPSGDVTKSNAALKQSEPLKPGPTDKGSEEPKSKPGGEPDAKVEAEPKAEAKPSEPKTPASVPVPVPAPQRSGFVPMLLGGIVAGLIGFATAWYVWGREDTGAELSAKVDAHAEAVAGLEASVADKASSEELSAVAERLATLESTPAADTGATDATIAAQAEALAALSSRIEALEKAPVEGSADPAAQAALAAYGREVEALRKEVTDQMAQMNAALEAAKETEAQAAARQEEAAAAAARAAEQRALLDVQQALETGAPYSEALGRISSAEIPEGLAGPAADGVPTLDSLKASFAPAAREALKTARQETAGENGGGFGSWVTRQVGARSLEPKEGDDPDAVLSRAESALNAGDLSTALSEIAALPPGGQEAMAGWVAKASLRNDAVSGADALSATLTSN